MIEFDKSTPRCALKIGSTIAGRYVVRTLLGAGSTGWVVKVTDEALGGELVALKVIYPHLLLDEGNLVRLRREVVLARQLAHRAIVHVHDFEENPDGETFLAMEYVRGVDLADLLFERNGRGLPFDETLLVLAQVAEALLYAHQQGIVHRDLKPSNVLVGYDSRVRVCDFGLAKSFEQEFGLTRTGESPGSPVYMAPEQFRALPVDQRTDIYAFGLLAYELVVGRAPFLDTDYFRLAERHVHEPLPPLLRNGQPVAPWFEEIVQRCCAKSPADRIQTLADVIPVLRREVSRKSHIKLPRERIWWLTRISHRTVIRSLVALLLMAAIGGFEWAYGQAGTRSSIMSRVFFLEAQIGHELWPLKWYLRMHASLLRPQSVFDVIKAGDKSEMKGLLWANAELRRRGELRYPEPLSVQDSEGFTVLQRVVKSGKKDMLMEIAEFGPATFGLDPDGETLMSRVVRTGNLELFASMMTLRLYSINALNTVTHDTPLQIAIRRQQRTMINSLLGPFLANPNIRNAEGDSALHLAVKLCDLRSVQALVSIDADTNVRDRAGRTPLMDTATLVGPPSEILDIVKMLLSDPLNRRATIDARDNDGLTALMLAADASNEAVAAELVNLGADRTVRDGLGRTAFDRAVEHRAPLSLLQLLATAPPGAVAPPVPGGGT